MWIIKDGVMYETDEPKHVAERYDWKYILVIA